MTSDKRLDQLEPLVADVLQKVDRLIEGQGKLFDLVVGTNETVSVLRSEVDQVKRMGEITANGLANLTNSVQNGFSDLQQQMTDVKTSQTLILQLLREKLP